MNKGRERHLETRPKRQFPVWSGQNLLNHEGVDVDERGLEKVQAEHGNLAFLAIVGHKLSPTAEEDEIVDAIPAFDDVQPFLDLSSETLVAKVVTKEDRFLCFTEFADRLVGWMLDGGSGESTEDALCFRGSETQGSGILHHLIILLPNQFPVDRSRQNGLKVRIIVWPARFGAIEFLGVNSLESWEKLETKE